MEEIKLFSKDLKKNDWIGVVVNNLDPLFSGRCQIKVYLLYDNLANEDLPWAVPVNSTFFASDGAGSLSVPKIGQIVRVQFNNSDLYAPEYSTIQNIDTQLSKAIKDDYDGTHVLAFDPDEELSLIYQKKLGIQLYFRGSFLQISPDSMITIQHANSDSIIQLEGDKCNITTKNEVNIAAGARVELVADEVAALGKTTTKVGQGPYYSGLLAEPLFSLLSVMAKAIDAKMPQTPGVNESLVEQIKNTAISKNVLIGT